jgi:hypothetical protein
MPARFADEDFADLLLPSNRVKGIGEATKKTR